MKALELWSEILA